MATGNVSQCSKVKAVANYFVPIKFLLMDKQLKETGKGRPDYSEANSTMS